MAYDQKWLYQLFKRVTGERLSALKWDGGLIFTKTQIPDYPGVFIFYDLVNGEIQYERVGFSTNLRRRYVELTNTTNSSFFEYSILHVDYIIAARRELKNLLFCQDCDKNGIIPYMKL